MKKSPFDKVPSEDGLKEGYLNRAASRLLVLSENSESAYSKLIASASVCIHLKLRMPETVAGSVFRYLSRGSSLQSPGPPTEPPKSAF